MRTLLHILTKPDDTLALEIIRLQKTDLSQSVITADLTKKNPDYKRLVENVFAADAVNVW